MANMYTVEHLADNLFELRIDVGKGYRVYYTLQGNRIVLLLCAGNKTSQSKDIKKAMLYKLDYEQFIQDNR